MVAVSAFSGLVSSACALASAAAIAPMVSLDRCMAALPTGEKIKADRARLRPFGPNAMAGGFFGVSGIKALSSDLARSWSRKAERVAQKRPANSAQELDSLMSTTRTASIVAAAARCHRDEAFRRSERSARTAARP